MPPRHKSKTLKSFNTEGQEEKITEAAKTVMRRESLFLTGIPGSGKTHLAIGLLWHLAVWLRDNGSSSSYRFKFYPAVEFFFDLKRTFNSQYQTEEDILSPLMALDLLVFDDIGSEKISDWSRQMFYLLIDRYYRNEKQIIITSNLSLDSLALAYDDRIASRLCEMGKVITLSPIDHRVTA